MTASVETTTTTHITSPAFLTFGRVLWGILAVISLGVSIQLYQAIFAHFETSSPAVREALAALRLTPQVYGGIFVAMMIIVSGGVFLVGVIIFRVRSHDRMGLLVALNFVTFGIVSIVRFQILLMIDPAAVASPFLTFVKVVGWCTSIPMGMMYPTGRFAPRWTAYAAAFSVLCFGAWAVAQDAFPEMFLQQGGSLTYLVPGLFISLWSLTLAVQIHRYRVIFTPTQRQQTKWVVLALMIALLANAPCLLITIFFPAVLEPTPLGLGFNLIVAACHLTLVTLPISVAIALFRYRLWDVDFVINRSLVYGAVTVIVLLAFIGGALLIRIILGEGQSELALILAAVGAAVLFTPVRQAAQHFVDRRLYGLRFDLSDVAHAQHLPEVKNPGALSGRKLGIYQTLDVIGKGGMGEVYKGITTDQLVALKILPLENARQEEFRARFEREAETMRSLDHPHIVKLYDAGDSGGVRYLALEFVDGVTLADYLDRIGALTLETTCAILKPIAEALDYAHAQGIVHRDIKVSNIMLRGGFDTPTPSPVLMDFGIAKVGGAATRYTGTGMIGTVEYLAPEQIIAAREVDHRADIYALGVVVFEMLTGRLPFSGNSGQVLFAHLGQPPPNPRLYKPNLSHRVARVVMRALAKAPEDRYQSAGAFATAFAESEADVVNVVITIEGDS